MKSNFNAEIKVLMGYILVMWILIQSSEATVSFRRLGLLPEGIYSYASAISADGSTVVGEAYSPEYLDGQAFRWTETSGMQGLGCLSTTGLKYSRADGVSSDGSIITGTGSIQGYAFRWENGVMTNIGSFGPSDISSNGNIIVGQSFILSEAGRWENGVITSLGRLPGSRNSHATSVSGDGSIIAGNSGNQAFRWTASDGMIGLGYLPGQNYSIAQCISTDGTVIAGSSGLQNGPREVFRWTAENGMQSIGSIGDYSNAMAISADGSTIVGNSEEGLFVWREDTGFKLIEDILTDSGIDLADFVLSDVVGISDDGLTIVGNGMQYYPLDPDYEEHQGWIVTIPEPATVLLLGLGGVLLRKRSKSS